MRTRLVLLLAAAALAVGAAPAAAKPCGSYPDENGRWTMGEIEGAGIYDVTASPALPCATARRVAMRAYRDRHADATTWTYRGFWSCRVLDEGYEYLRARCRTPGGRRVTWESGS